MPIAIKYLDGGKGVRLTASGIVGGQELIAATAEIFSRNLVAEPYFYCLVDAEHIGGVDISVDQLRRTASQDIAASKIMPRFIVACYAMDDLPFAFARMWQVFVEPTGWETQIYRSKAAALAWTKETVWRKFGARVTLE